MRRTFFLSSNLNSKREKLHLARTWWTTPRPARGAASIDADAMKISLIRPHLRTLTVRLLTAELVASGPPPQLG